MSTLSKARVMSGEDLSPFLKMALYGPPGVGKTGFASDADISRYPIAPEETLYINIESGTLTLKVLGRRCAVLDVEKHDPKNGKDPFTHLEQIHKDLLAGGHGYKTVILDTVSSLQKEDLDTVAQVTIEKTNPANRHHGRFGKQQADYGINTDKMRWILRAFRDLPMNVVFVLGETQEKTNTGASRTVPDLTPKLRESLYPMMDIIAYMYAIVIPEGQDRAGEKQRIFVAGPNPALITKDRSDALGNYLADVTLPDVLALVFDRIKVSNS
ncbi:hypothetical protein D3C78_18580 [compost metagenome]